MTWWIMRQRDALNNESKGWPITSTLLTIIKRHLAPSPGTQNKDKLWSQK